MNKKSNNEAVADAVLGLFGCLVFHTLRCAAAIAFAALIGVAFIPEFTRVFALDRESCRLLVFFALIAGAIAAVMDDLRSWLTLLAGRFFRETNEPAVPPALPVDSPEDRVSRFGHNRLN